MAGPWEKYGQSAPEGPWAKYAQGAAGEKRSGSFLPLSRDEQGNLSFDSDAGIVGVIKRAVTLPGDVATGKVDPRSPEATGRAFDLAGLGSPVGTAIRAGERAIPGALRAVRRTEPEPPSAEALRAHANAGYERARHMGVDYSSAAVKTLADEIRSSLEANGIVAELSPKTFSILSKLQNPPSGSVATVAGLDAARRALGHAAGDFTNKTEQLAARQVMDRLDEFLAASDPSSVVAGPAAAAGKALGEARGNYAAAMRSDRITGAQERAELNAAVANSGQNVDNQIRQRLRDVLTRPKEARGYSPQELALIERAARGTPVANTARWVGNALGGGGGLGALTSGALGGAAGGAAGGPLTGLLLGLGVPAVGYGSRQLAAALTKRQVAEIDDLIRRRSPLFEQMRQDAPLEVISPEQRAALVRGLLLQSSDR